MTDAPVIYKRFDGRYFIEGTKTDVPEADVKLALAAGTIRERWCAMQEMTYYETVAVELPSYAACALTVR